MQGPRSTLVDAARWLALPVLVLGAIAVPVIAQQGAVVFKHFRTYPPGQWSSTMQSYRGGAPFGPPQTTTTCSSPLTPAGAASVARLGNSMAPQCRINVLADEEKKAEYEQLCFAGAGQHRIHTTLHAIDDKTVMVEVESTVGGQESANVRSTARYLGACPAGEAEAAARGPVLPKPSKEDCVQLPQLRQNTEDGIKSCAQIPTEYRTTCNSHLQASMQMLKMMEQSCK